MTGLSAARLKGVRLVLTDVDGVLTAGAIYHFVDTMGELVEFKGIHAHDSIALAWLAESGLRTGVITGRVSKGVEARLKLLKVAHIVQGRLDKSAALDEILALEKMTPAQVAYIGDDLPDLAVMRRVALAAAPADARPEVRALAHWTTRARGGAGAFRELAEKILRAQGLWDAVLARYR